MRAGEYVRITKLSAAENPSYPTAEAFDVRKDWSHATVSPPTDYWVEGTLEVDLEEGEPCVMYRKVRNGTEALGLFTTSVIRKITAHTFETANSVYRIEVLGADDNDRV